MVLLSEIDTLIPMPDVSWQLAGGMIFIYFNTATDKAGLRGQFSCGLLLDPESLAKLTGTSDIPQCVFVNSSVVAVSVCWGATLQMSEKVILAPSVPRGLRQQTGCATAASGPSFAAASSVCFFTSLGAGNTVRVERPDSPMAPVAVLKGPSILGPCDDLTLDASSSYGSGGRQLQFFFGLLPGAANDAALRRLIFAASRAPYHTNTITIPAKSLLQEANYSFMVSNIFRDMVLSVSS
jgi:hypothetical protein